MKNKIDIEYLKSLSLFDLYEMLKFYDSLSYVKYTDWSAYPAKPELDLAMCDERINLLEIAIRFKKCEMDKKLFGSSILKNLDSFTEKSCLEENSKKHR